MGARATGGRAATSGRARRRGGAPTALTDRLSRALRTRTALGRRATALLAEARARRVPLHWSGLLGAVSLASTVVLLVTGVVLMLFYAPSGETVVYAGAYAPLHGAEVSRAYESILAISFELPGGLVLRQVHHWAALLLPASLILQLLVTFFTGGFRRPRRGSWLLLFLLLLVALLGGWSGYALPDDMLSGSGLRIVEGIVLGIPVVGTWAASLLFGGSFPGRIIENLYPVHVAVVTVLLVVLVAARARLAWRHGPARFAGRDDRGRGDVPLWPVAAGRAGGLAAVVAGILVLVGATVTIAPVWLYGPGAPGDASAGSQPDWYTGFLDGALRLVPPGWELEWGGYTLTLAVLVPLAVVGLFLLAVAVHPFLEAWITDDPSESHVLDRPRNAATRTGIGVAGIVFYGVLWGAASADIAATHLRLSLESVITAFQLLLLAGPVVGFVVTRRVCLALQRRDAELVLHGYETGRIVRLPGGEYVEVHAPVSEAERRRLTAHEHPEPARARRDRTGRVASLERLRVALSRWFFQDRILLPEAEVPAGPAPDPLTAAGTGAGDPAVPARGSRA